VGFVLVWGYAIASMAMVMSDREDAEDKKMGRWEGRGVGGHPDLRIPGPRFQSAGCTVLGVLGAQPDSRGVLSAAFLHI